MLDSVEPEQDTRRLLIEPGERAVHGDRQITDVGREVRRCEEELLELCISRRSKQMNGVEEVGATYEVPRAAGESAGSERTAIVRQVLEDFLAHFCRYLADGCNVTHVLSSIPS